MFGPWQEERPHPIITIKLDSMESGSTAFWLAAKEAFGEKHVAFTYNGGKTEVHIRCIGSLIWCFAKLAELAERLPESR